MTTMPMMAVLEFLDFVIIAGIVLVLGGAMASRARPDEALDRLEREMGRIRRRVDALLEHQGVRPPGPPPSGLSPEVERLAASPDTKIEAIKRCREENPGMGLKEAKEKIEEFYRRGH